MTYCNWKDFFMTYNYHWMKYSSRLYFKKWAFLLDILIFLIFNNLKTKIIGCFSFLVEIYINNIKSDLDIFLKCAKVNTNTNEKQLIPYTNIFLHVSKTVEIGKKFKNFLSSLKLTPDQVQCWRKTEWRREKILWEYEKVIGRLVPPISMKIKTCSNSRPEMSLFNFGESSRKFLKLMLVRMEPTLSGWKIDIWFNW